MPSSKTDPTNLPLYAYHHSARLQSAKVRAFLDFVVALTREL